MYHRMRFCKRTALTVLVTLLLAAGATPVTADSVAIVNPSFELPGTVKMEIDIDNVPGWSESDGTSAGVETGWGATDGEWTAYLGANAQIWNLTEHAIEPNKVYHLEFDAKETAGGQTLLAELFYPDANDEPVVLGETTVDLTSVPGGSVDRMLPLTTFTLDYASGSDGEHIGQPLGIRFTVVEGSWTGLDNLKLEYEDAKRVIWVGETDDQDGDTVIDDIGWVDWLTAQGFTVDHRPDYWMTLDANKVAELDTADLVIVSRNTDSGDYNQTGEPDLWNSVTSPIILCTSYLARNSRWSWINSTSLARNPGTPTWEAVDLDHPVLDGVTLESIDPNDPNAPLTVSALDPNVGTGHTTHTTTLDVGNGNIIAKDVAVDQVGIVEWLAGMEHFDGGPVAAGPRMLFTAGTSEDGGPQGAFNLTPAGEQLFLNAIASLCPAKPVHAYPFDGDPNDSMGGAHGTLEGGATIVDGALLTTDQDQWLELPGEVIDMNSFSEVSIEAWYTPQAGANTGWTMMAYFGDAIGEPFTNGANGWFITSARGDDVSRAAISVGNVDAPWETEVGANGPEYDDGLLHHMVGTISATDVSLYVDGIRTGTTPLLETNSLSQLSNNFAWLCKSGYSGDDEWIGAIHEFNIYDIALSDAQAADLFSQGLD